MTQRSRRRRLSEKRDIFRAWARDEGVSETVLFGLMLYLENWNKDKTLAATGCKIFMGEKVNPLPVVSLDEGIWLMERL